MFQFGLVIAANLGVIKSSAVGGLVRHNELAVYVLNFAVQRANPEVLQNEIILRCPADGDLK